MTGNDSHSKVMGYALWIFGFTGAHRFYYGKPFTGTLMLFILGPFALGMLLSLPLFGLLSPHKLFESRHVTGTLLLFTLGLFGIILWLIDFFLIPSMDRNADKRFRSGPINYSLAWILLGYLGLFGVHRFYMGKWLTGLLYLCTGGLLFIGILYDFWTLNDQINVRNGQIDG